MAEAVPAAREWGDYRRALDAGAADLLARMSSSAELTLGGPSAVEVRRAALYETPFYYAWQRVFGWCGHRHRYIEAATACGRRLRRVLER